uniref:Nsp1_C domain-containing protein n=1 Tax=Macrostomum lignano TaxID=282301 RepID=A0A1I8HBP6_9PLAT
AAATPAASTATTAGSLTGFSLSSATSTAAPATAAFSGFGQQTAASTAAPAAGSATSSAAATTAASLIGFGLSAASASGGSTLPSFGASAFSTAKPAVATTAAKFVGFQLPAASSATASSASAAAVPAASRCYQQLRSGPQTSVSSGGSLTYQQLDELVSQWTAELVDHERQFLEEAARINAWDRYLLENGKKIGELQEQVDRAVSDQTRLDQELEFLASQQQELEEALAPLEQAVQAMPPTGQSQADREREALFNLTESLDSELRHSMQEVREAVEYVNSQQGGGGSGSSGEADAMGKISRILGAHLESLQWITHTTQSLQRKMDSLSEEIKLKQRSFI